MIGEELYYRCKPENCSRPYDRISLYDISHNRNFGDSISFPSEDVLFNIIETDDRERYDNMEVIILKIAKLNGNMTFIKEILSRNDESLKAVIKLIHDPKPCMYPHSVFEISVNGITINPTNYNDLLNKGNRTYKNLRSDIRQELTSMLQSGIIDVDKTIEIIDEP